jgi:hypothetical protein|tara:strand:- start:47 stop:736 length:690 start_codon:yes stop_codon:yes gene_type:complete
MASSLLLLLLSTASAMRAVVPGARTSVLRMLSIGGPSEMATAWKREHEECIVSAEGRDEVLDCLGGDPSTAAPDVRDAARQVDSLLECIVDAENADEQRACGSPDLVHTHHECIVDAENPLELSSCLAPALEAEPLYALSEDEEECLVDAENAAEQEACGWPTLMETTVDECIVHAENAAEIGECNTMTQVPLVVGDADYAECLVNAESTAEQWACDDVSLLTSVKVNI